MQAARVEHVEALAKARVARRLLDPVERLEVRPCHLHAPNPLELQQQGIPQAERREPRQQVIHQGDVVPALVEDGGEHAPRSAQQPSKLRSLRQNGALIDTCLATLGSRDSVLIQNKKCTRNFFAPLEIFLFYLASGSFSAGIAAESAALPAVYGQSQAVAPDVVDVYEGLPCC
jgi:hypothetical protein